MIISCIAWSGMEKETSFKLSTPGTDSKLVIIKLVGFGRACAHPSFWAHCHAKRGAARPPPIAASLLLIGSPKIDLKNYRTRAAPMMGFPGKKAFLKARAWAARVMGFFSFHWTTEAMKYDVPYPSPCQSQLRWSFWQYFGVLFILF